MTGEYDHEHERERVDTSHLDGVEDGCGCAEVWEHLSGGRDGGTDDGTDADAGTDERGDAEAAGDERSDAQTAGDERGDVDATAGSGSTAVDAGGT